MYAHNSQRVQFLPCGVTLLRFKFRCSRLFSLTELTLVGSDVILNRPMLPALPPTKPLTCLGRSSRKGRVWWQWQNIKFLHYRSKKCQMIRLWCRIPLYVWIFIFKWIRYRLMVPDAAREKWDLQNEKNYLFGEGRKKRTCFFSPTSWDTDKSSKHCFITKYRRHKTSKHTNHNVQKTGQSSQNTHQHLSSKLHSKRNLQWNQVTSHEENLALITGTINTIHKKWKICEN